MSFNMSLELVLGIERLAALVANLSIRRIMPRHDVPLHQELD